MTIDPAIFRALVAQGATPEMLLAVVEADAAVQADKLAKRRADTAARVQKHRAKKTGNLGNSGNALQGVTGNGDPAAPLDDIYSNPPDPSEAEASEPPFAEKVVSEWNDGPAAAGAQRANALTPKRRKHLANRVREAGKDGVLAAIRGIACSDWHTGHGANGWRADLGWLLENAERVAKFSERASTAPPPPKPVSPAAHAAFVADLAKKPWMRGRENELPLARPPTGPRSIGQLTAGIVGAA